MEMHLLDNSELDIDEFHPVLPMHGGPASRVHRRRPILVGGLLFLPYSPRNPFGPRSPNIQSVPRHFTVWHPAGAVGTIPIQPSSNLPLGTAGIPRGRARARPATATSTRRSSYPRHLAHSRRWARARRHNHVILTRPDGSGCLRASAKKPGAAAPQLVVRTCTSTPTPFDPNAHWLHLTGHPFDFHLGGFDGSAFYARTS